MEEDELAKYWNYVASEAKSVQKRRTRLEKWKKVAKNWLADYADKRAYDFVLKVMSEVIKIGKPVKILDIGCGPGKWAVLFAKNFGSTTAIDISPNMILLAKENARKDNLHNIDFHVMDVSKLDLYENTYDMVNCVTVLQHIFDDGDWRRAIQEISRVTKVGGYVLLFETAPDFAIRRRTRHLSIRTMRQYVGEFRMAGADFVYWRAADLSLPVTFLGLRKYAASFNRRVYYFMSGQKLFPASFLSFLSWAAAILAGLIDYRLAETPLSFLSAGRIMVFQKVK